MRSKHTTIFASMIASSTLMGLGQTDAYAQGPMLAQPWFRAGNAPCSLVRAILDDDGGPDLVTANFSSDDDLLAANNISKDVSTLLNRRIMNHPPTCNAGGPYAVECGGKTTDFELDVSGSSSPDEEELGFLWATDCPGGVFDDNTLKSPTLTIDTLAPCAPLNWRSCSTTGGRARRH